MFTHAFSINKCTIFFYLTTQSANINKKNTLTRNSINYIYLFFLFNLYNVAGFLFLFSSVSWCHKQPNHIVFYFYYVYFFYIPILFNMSWGQEKYKGGVILFHYIKCLNICIIIFILLSILSMKIIRCNVCGFATNYGMCYISEYTIHTTISWLVVDTIFFCYHYYFFY